MYHPDKKNLIDVVHCLEWPDNLNSASTEIVAGGHVVVTGIVLLEWEK